MKSLGRHVILELWEATNLNDARILDQAAQIAAEVAGKEMCRANQGRALPAALDLPHHAEAT